MPRKETSSTGGSLGNVGGGEQNKKGDGSSKRVGKKAGCGRKKKRKLLVSGGVRAKKKAHHKVWVRRCDGKAWSAWMVKKNTNDIQAYFHDFKVKLADPNDTSTAEECMVDGVFARRVSATDDSVMMSGDYPFLQLVRILDPEEEDTDEAAVAWVNNQILPVSDM